MVDRTPEPSLNCWVAFDGLMTGKVGSWIVSLQNTPLVSTFILVFGTDLAVSSARTTMPLSFAISVGFRGGLRDRLAALTRTGTAMSAMKPERNEIGCAFIIGQCCCLAWRTIESWRLPLSKY